MNVTWDCRLNQLTSDAIAFRVCSENHLLTSVDASFRCNSYMLNVFFFFFAFLHFIPRQRSRNHKITAELILASSQRQRNELGLWRAFSLCFYGVNLFFPVSGFVDFPFVLECS